MSTLQDLYKLPLNQHKVLVANRGEIAIRIMRACAKLGLPFCAIYTAEDAASGSRERESATHGRAHTGL